MKLAYVVMLNARGKGSIDYLTPEEYENLQKENLQKEGK